MTTKSAPPGAAHWDAVYREKAESGTSWYRPKLDASLRLVTDAGLDPEAPAIDVGAGRSTFVDHLLDHGVRDVTAVDLSAEALKQLRGRLGARGDAVTWRVGDIAALPLPAAYFGLWHDRAVFHFLVDADARARYVAQAAAAIRPGGHLLVATFAPHGPERCSGLPVRRYDADALAAEFAGAFDVVSRVAEDHITPFGKIQPFTYVLLRRRSRGTAPC
jgi:SAM-dependent methyltransferase